MKNIGCIIVVAILMLGTDLASAQKLPTLDKSPHDIAYFPRMGGDKVARVLYGRPQAKGRAVFGKLVKYGKVWRTGANEATEITFYKDVTINGKELKAGTYALFTIPEEGKWTFIFNTDLHQWGAYTYKEKADVLRVEATPTTLDEEVDAFTILFDKKKYGADLILAWEKIMVSLPITVE